MKNQNGITLIALVITIIVLLILAGISIAMLTGENGLLTKAREADTKNTEAEIADRINMAITAEYASILAGDSVDTEPNIKTNNGLDDNYTVTVNQVPATPTADVDVLTITKSGITGKITYVKNTAKYTITKAEVND